MTLPLSGSRQCEGLPSPTRSGLAGVVGLASELAVSKGPLASAPSTLRADAASSEGVSTLNRPSRRGQKRTADVKPQSVIACCAAVQCNARGVCQLGFCKCDPGW